MKNLKIWGVKRGKLPWGGVTGEENGQLELAVSFESGEELFVDLAFRVDAGLSAVNLTVYVTGLSGSFNLKVSNSSPNKVQECRTFWLPFPISLKVSSIQAFEPLSKVIEYMYSTISET